MSRSVIPKNSQADALDALTAAMGLFAGGEVRLYTNAIVLDSDVALTDLTEATFDGYMEKPVGTWFPAALAEDGYVSVEAPGVQFVATGTTKPETVQGYYLTDMAGTKLLAVWALDAPIAMGVDLLIAVMVRPRIAFAA